VKNTNNTKTASPAPSASPNQAAPASTAAKVSKSDTHKASDGGNEQSVAALLSTSAATVLQHPATGGKNLLDVREAEVSGAVQNKVQSMSEARQRFAEAADLDKGSEEQRVKAREVAEQGAILLYQQRVAGTVTADEVSASLGDTFGWKAKQDGSPSKTPKGMGEAVRKRIVRAVQAAEYINGGEASRFFDGLPKDAITDVLTGMVNGSRGFWAAYEDFASIKRDHMVRVEAAFDPKKVIAFTEALLQDGSPEVLASNMALVDAYRELRQAINIAFTEAAKHLPKAA
jgi:hypothetical protein